jgi:hypothetical protein
MLRAHPLFNSNTVWVWQQTEKEHVDLCLWGQTNAGVEGLVGEGDDDDAFYLFLRQ